MHIGITLSGVCLYVFLSSSHTLVVILSWKSRIAMFRRRHVHSLECCNYVTINKHVILVWFQTSYSSEIVLPDLRPFTKYVVQGAVSNYYTEYLSEALGPAKVFKTDIGGKVIKI